MVRGRWLYGGRPIHRRNNFSRSWIIIHSKEIVARGRVHVVAVVDKLDPDAFKIIVLSPGPVAPASYPMAIANSPCAVASV